MGIAAALAVPVTTDEEIVFVAIVFDIAYNLVNNKAIPIKFCNEKLMNERRISNEEDAKSLINFDGGEMENKAIFTRMSFYRVIESRLNA